jgi:hypothetical protein
VESHFHFFPLGFPENEGFEAEIFHNIKHNKDLRRSHQDLVLGHKGASFPKRSLGNSPLSYG